MSARVIQVIETELLRRGAGVESDPIRIVRQYWSLDGTARIYLTHPVGEGQDCPPPLLSLFDMLKAYAHTYSVWVGDLARLEETLRNRRERDGDTHPAGGEDLDVVDMHRWLQPLRDGAVALHMRSVWKQLDHMRQRFTPETPLVDALVMVIELRRRIQEDLADRRFYYVPDEREEYYLYPLFRWHEVWVKFPDTMYDTEEAGKCLALGRHTACVFHLMRVAEIGLRALARRLRVRLPKGKRLDVADWQEILQGIDGRIRDLRQRPRKPKRDAGLTEYAEIRAELAAFKDAWRNHVAHARARYDEHQALSVHLHVQGLMQRLAGGVPK